MAAQRGSSFLLKVGDGGGTEVFTTLGGFRSNSFSFDNEQIDITNKDAPDDQTLLAGGTKARTIEGSGVFVDDAAFATFEGYVRNASIDNYQIDVPDWGIYEGAYLATKLEFAGEHNGELTFNVTLVSSGAVTFTPA